MENQRVMKILKVVGTAAALAGLQALAPFATEIVTVLPPLLAPIVITLLGYFLKSPAQEK